MAFVRIYEGYDNERNYTSDWFEVTDEELSLLSQFFNTEKMRTKEEFLKEAKELLEEREARARRWAEEDRKRAERAEKAKKKREETRKKKTAEEIAADPELKEALKRLFQDEV